MARLCGLYLETDLSLTSCLCRRLLCDFARRALRRRLRRRNCILRRVRTRGLARLYQLLRGIYTLCGELVSMRCGEIAPQLRLRQRHGHLLICLCLLCRRLRLHLRLGFCRRNRRRLLYRRLLRRHLQSRRYSRHLLRRRHRLFFRPRLRHRRLNGLLFRHLRSGRLLSQRSLHQLDRILSLLHHLLTQREQGRRHMRFDILGVLTRRRQIILKTRLIPLGRAHNLRQLRRRLCKRLVDIRTRRVNRRLHL